MDPHAPPSGGFGSEPFSPVDFLGRAGETPAERAKRHKDVSYNLESWGSERVWVMTTGLAVGDFPWPALVVPDPQNHFLPKGFHVPQFKDTHVAVMLLGLGDTRRHSEHQWFRYVSKGEHGIVTRFSAGAFENWLPFFLQKAGGSRREERRPARRRGRPGRRVPHGGQVPDDAKRKRIYPCE